MHDGSSNIYSKVFLIFTCMLKPEKNPTSVQVSLGQSQFEASVLIGLSLSFVFFNKM